MSEHTLLYVIAIATTLNALAFVLIVIKGAQLARQMEEVQMDVRRHMEDMMGEMLPLVREVRETVGDARQFTQSGRRITEEVLTGLVMRRVSPGWIPSRHTMASGVSAARELVHMLRVWVDRKRHQEVAEAVDDEISPDF